MYENVSVDEKETKPSLKFCSSEDRFTRVLISGAGFLADAYDLFVINLSVDLMSRCEYKTQLTSALKSRIKSMALAGAIVGQLGFGSVADLIGRKWVFIMTCTIVILGSVLSATVIDSSGAFGIFSQLSLWRFLLGVGVGGEYPLSAAVTAESSDPGTEIRNLAMVFSMQGLGTLLCAVVLVTLTHTMGEKYEAQWRLALLIGAAPMIVAFYFRWKMHETRWNTEQQQHTEQGEAEGEVEESGLTLSTLTNDSDCDIPHTLHTHRATHTTTQRTTPHDQHTHHPTARHTQDHTPPPEASYQLETLQRSKSGRSLETLKTHFSEGSKQVIASVRSNYWKLLGTAGAWFILDIVFYGNGLFSGQVTEVMEFAHNPRSEALASLFLQSISLPGYLFTILYAERIGLRRLQLCGFAATAAFFLILAALQPFLVQLPALYAFVYGLTFFAQNFGANSTTYIIPSLLFPLEHRATCHGISAAAGKFGALLGAQVFLDVVGAFCAGGTCSAASPAWQVSAGLQLTFCACGALSVLGYIWTHFLVEDPVLPSIEDSSFAGTVTFNRLAYYAAGGGEEEGVLGGEGRAGEREENVDLECAARDGPHHAHAQQSSPQDRSPTQVHGQHQHQAQAPDHTENTTQTHTMSDLSLQLEYDTEPHAYRQAHHPTHPSQETQETTQEYRGGFDVTAEVNTVVHNPLLYCDEQST